MSTSGSTTTTISGGNINEVWPNLKQSMESTYNGQSGVTVTFNDINHSYTITYNNFSQALPDDSTLPLLGYQINQNGTKLKVAPDGSIEIIYTKQ